MPFGVSGELATFIWLLYVVLEGFDNVVVYGNDRCAVYYKNVSDHLGHVVAVLERL